MALPLFAVAIPILHSSGGWIASTTASGYIAGTLSGTWLGAFVLGNAGLLSSLGVVSAAGIVGASGSLATLASGAALSIGAGLTAVGLGGVASAMGIAPITTFLGLTPVGWGVTASAAILAASLGYYFKRKIMRDINAERAKGGLEPITISQIVKEVRLLEKDSVTTILERLAVDMPNIELLDEKSNVKISGTIYSISRLRYLVNKDCSEEVVFVTKTGKKKSVITVKNGGGIPDIIYT